MQEQKKSAVDLTALALGVVVIGIVVTVGAVMLTQMRDNQIPNLDTGTVLNESVTTLNQAGDILGVGCVKSISSVVNATGGQTLTAGNYTLTVNPIDCTGTIKATTAITASYNNTNVKVTYLVYNKSDTRYALPDNATTGLLEFGNWFDILVIVGIAAVVLALIFMAFGSRGGESTGVGY